MAEPVGKLIKAKKKQIKNHRSATLNLLIAVADYQKQILGIKKLAEDPDCPKVVQLQARKALINEFHTLANFEAKNPDHNAPDPSDISDDELDAMVNAALERSLESPDVIEVDFE